MSDVDGCSPSEKLTPCSQGSPGSYRPTTSRLASLSGGSVLSVEYRLAPQHPFPAALLDILVAYLSLLYPPTSSHRKPMDPSRIVFAGDSAGGVLLFSVLQFLQHTASNTPKRFHSHNLTFPIPKPAGIAVLSMTGDLTHSLPSYHRNRVHDLFLEVPWYHTAYPSCAIWPANPPRPDVYCPTRSFLHPFVTPALAESWADSPPIWLASGDELFSDGAKLVARKAALQGISVTWTNFEAMPHCFPTVPGLTRSRQSQVLMERWAMFCRECVDGTILGRQRVRASKIAFENAEESPIELEDHDDPSFIEVAHMIDANVRSIEEQFQKQANNGVTPKL